MPQKTDATKTCSLKFLKTIPSLVHIGGPQLPTSNSLTFEVDLVAAVETRRLLSEASMRRRRSMREGVPRIALSDAMPGAPVG